MQIKLRAYAKLRVAAALISHELWMPGIHYTGTQDQYNIRVLTVYLPPGFPKYLFNT